MQPLRHRINPQTFVITLRQIVWGNNKVRQFYTLKTLIFRSLYRVPKNKVKQFLNLPHLEGRYNPQFLNNKVKQFSEAPS
jgi:hypothetical protein